MASPIDNFRETVLPTRRRHGAEEKHQLMLVKAAKFAPKTTATKPSAAKIGTTR
jgi:hypothetical protein